jgi:Domain of unknown function (DUF4132)
MSSTLASHFSDETIRELRATVDKHGQDALGRQALESLAAIRDDRAIRHVHAIAMHGKGKLAKRAAQILGDVSRQRGLSVGELEDLVVPELGLDEQGSMTLDYGSRRFTVGFDEQLDPFVRDEGGARLKALPHAASEDDAEKAARAAEVWKQLKADAKVVSREQVQRLERAMCDERQWTAEALAKRVVSHRLLGHLARRLVFATHTRATTPSKSGAIGQTFRVATDGTYDDGERAITLAPDERVAIAHPVMLDDATRARWRQVFSDYEIVQPFAQLDRQLVALPEADLQASSTAMFSGRAVHAKSFWGLKHHGWTLGYQVTKKWSGRWETTLDVSPYLDWHGRLEDGEHTLGGLSVSGATFGGLPLIVRAELLRDVDSLKPIVR